MPRGLGTAFIERLYLHFLCNCFLKVFFTHNSMNNFETDLWDLIKYNYSQVSGPGNNVPHFPELEPYYQMQFSIIPRIHTFGGG